MKIAAFVPFWENYENNEYRIKKIAGRFLLSYTLEKLGKVSGVEHIYVYSSNDNVKNYIEPGIRYEYVQRPSFLDSSETSIDQIIREFLKVVDVDIVLLVHPTSPLLKIGSIQSCLDSVLKEGYDSGFTAVKYQKLAWFRSAPINYDLDRDIPKLKDVDPVFVEQSSLYVFKRNSFERSGHRVCGSTKICEIDQIEGLEVRNSMDFELMELIINSGMYEEKYYEDL